jgi:hypothetical protein
VTPNIDFLRANSDAYDWLAVKLQKMELRKQAEALRGRLAFAVQFAAELNSMRSQMEKLKIWCWRLGESWTNF